VKEKALQNGEKMTELARLESQLETIKQNIRTETRRTPFLVAEARNLAKRIVKLRDEL